MSHEVNATANADLSRFADLLDIELVKSIVVEAGDRAIGMRADIKPEFKSDQSLVTHIDRETEQFIRASLEARYPDYAFQGEEFGRFGADGAPLWAVDPIDGTTNMVYGLTHWCVSVGLVHEGHALGGAVYLPLTRELYWAKLGEGAYCNGVRLQVKDRTEIHREDTVGFTSSVTKVLPLSRIAGRVRCIGSIAIECVYTAHGRLCSHVAQYEGLNDIAAALCIVKEAGCVVEYFDGSPFSIEAMVQSGKTSGLFVMAPPKMAALMKSLLTDP